MKNGTIIGIIETIVIDCPTKTIWVKLKKMPIFDLDFIK